ncbi:MAG: hypothetical protein Q9160_004000 [Pyrenula sp. 1 TL-2023]
MRGRPAWQPYQRAGPRPFSHSGVSSSTSGSGLAVSSPDASAPPGFVKDRVPPRTLSDANEPSRLKRQQGITHQNASNAANKAKQKIRLRESDAAKTAQLSAALQTMSTSNPPRGYPTAGSTEERSVRIDRDSQVAEDPSKITSWPLANLKSDIRQPAVNEENSTKRSGAMPFKVFADNHPIPARRYRSHSQERSNAARQSLEGHHLAKPNAHAIRRACPSESAPRTSRHALSPGDEMPSYRHEPSRNVYAGFETPRASTFAEPDSPWKRNDIPEQKRLSLERQPKRLQKRRHSESLRSETWSQNSHQVQSRRQ